MVPTFLEDCEEQTDLMAKCVFDWVRHSLKRFQQHRWSLYFVICMISIEIAEHNV
jgi:hypothetical protein